MTRFSRGRLTVCFVVPSIISLVYQSDQLLNSCLSTYHVLLPQLIVLIKLSTYQVGRLLKDRLDCDFLR